MVIGTITFGLHPLVEFTWLSLYREDNSPDYGELPESGLDFGEELGAAATRRGAGQDRPDIVKVHVGGLPNFADVLQDSFGSIAEWRMVALLLFVECWASEQAI